MTSRLSILNQNPRLLDGPRLLHELVRWERGDALALDFLSSEGESRDGGRWKYTYHELRKCVSSLTAALAETLSVPDSIDYHKGPQPVVPVLVTQSPGLYISELATLEAGAAFCPINLDAPKDRVKFIVGDVAAKVVLATRDNEEKLTWEGGPAIVYVDELFRIPGQVASPASSSCELRLAQTEDAAYVMYTSGSTGMPKGVSVSHRAVTQSLLAHNHLIPSFHRFLQFAAPSFDVSVFEIFFPLFRGSTLVGCHRPRMLNDLPGIINALEVDGCELTPTVAGSLLSRRENVLNLKLLLTIGEMLTRPVVDEFGYSETAEGLLYGMYGPTEAAIHCTVSCYMKAGSKVGNIGIPFETVSCFIAAVPEPSADAGGEIELLPLGEVGELVLGGPQLADGYLNRERENKAAFVTFDGERVYRTGDRARILEDGTIEVMGRISAGQVKLRGQRVELGEIEEVVYKHPGIKLAFASVLQGMLIVFASTEGQRVGLDDLLKICEKWLPKYMVPSELVIKSEFPYLPSGKVDKKKLEAEYLSSRADDSDDDDLQTPTERTVSKVLHDLLGFKVGAVKRLAAYGLDSLLAIRLASFLRNSGFRASPVEILQAETLRSIAQICDDQRGPAMDTATTQSKFDFQDMVEPVTKFFEQQSITDGFEEVMPCTPLQEALLLESAVDPAAYNNYVELRIEGDYDEQCIRRAISDWAWHNPILRTGFVDCHNPYSAYTQVVWKTLLASQVSVMEQQHARQDVGSLSVLRPLHICICRSEGHSTLLINIHHALYDGWALELLINDLECIFSGSSLLPHPPFRHVVENSLRIASSDLWAQRQYWQDHLSQFDAQSIPNFQSKADISRGLDVASLQTSISTVKLESTARALLVSPQSLIQAAYAMLLSSYLGKSDVCFGTVFSGRTASIDGIEDIVGPCLSTLPVRVDISTTSTMADAAQYLNSTIRKHLENDVLPLREIKKLSDATAGRPIFDTLLIWQQTLSETDQWRDKVNLVRSSDYLEFNLTLEVTPGRETIRLDANYQRAVLPSSQIDLLLRQIEQLVLSLIESPELPIEKGYASLSEELVSIQIPDPLFNEFPKSLSESVEAIAAQDPGKAAIDFVRTADHGNFDIERLTYEELNVRANQLARFLELRGVVPDDLVCICMEKSSELYVSILASVKAGAGYLPITPDTPPERIQHVLKEANVKLVLTSDLLKGYLQNVTPAEVVSVDEVDFSEFNMTNLPKKSNCENLAYAVFTSGSTGVPKGVLVTVGNVLNNLESLKNIYPHSTDSRLLQSCSQGFDVSVFEIFWTWHIGGCLCSAIKDVLFRDIEFLIQQLRITHLSMTSTVAALVNPDNVPSVEVLICAGEAMTPRVFQNWAGRGLYNAYGPSETTNVVTVAEDVKQCDVMKSIGKPLATVSLFVLAPRNAFQPVPRGAHGELCFGGSQVARGYLDTTQNAGKFINHPVYGRIYHTGDFGRLLPDENVIYDGRQDDQVKIRGQRVELGDINEALLRSHAVEDCLTLVVEGDTDDDRRLVTFWTLPDKPQSAFTILDADTSITQELYKLASSALPTYMVPSALIPISFLPSTQVGKVDKALLKKCFRSLSVEQLDSYSNSDRASVSHDWSELEQEIVRAVSQCSKVQECSIGPETSFFALGIDSISAISVVRDLRHGAGLNVEISDVLKHSSVARLAQHISSQQRIVASPTGLPTPEETPFDTDFLDAAATFLSTQEDGTDRPGDCIERILPCTPLQEAMLSASELTSSSAYMNQVVFVLKVTLAEFEDAWKQMVRRHEILRTRFIQSGHAKFAYSQVVLKEASRTADATVSTKPFAENLQETHDSNGGLSESRPPYSLRYVEQNGVLKMVLSMHHALYDGFAMSILYNEIEDYLHGIELPPPVSFTPFLRYMAGVNTQESDDYWKTLLRGLNPLPFSIAWPEAKPVSRVIKSCSASNLTWIEDCLKQHSSSLLAACQAAWAATIAQRIPSVDICFGNVVNGRTIPVEGLNRLVAPCFNTIPCRLRDLHRLSFMEAFRLMQAQNVDSLPYQLTALRRIQSQCSTEGMPLFDTLLLLQTPMREMDHSIWEIESETGSMDLPVVIEVIPRPSGNELELMLHVNNSSLSKEEATEVLHLFDEVLTKSLDNPRAQVIPSAEKDVYVANSQQRKDRDMGSEAAAGDDGKRWSELELQIRDVVSRFTTVPVADIRRSTSIYRLGLDSINAVQVATALRKEGYKLVASDILQHPSILDLADLITSQEDDVVSDYKEFDFAAFEQKHRDEILAKIANANEVRSVYPCTPVQCGMLAQTLHSGGREYVNGFSMELGDGVSLERLRDAWAQVARKCEILRTGFVRIEDSKHSFAMVVYSEEAFALPWGDAGDDNASDAEIMTSYVLERKPWKLEVMQKESKRQVRFTGHHALYDAQSLDIITADVEAAYGNGQIPTRKSLTTILGAILRSNEGDKEKSKAFWRDENRIFTNRFPDLTPLRENSTRSIARATSSVLPLSKIEELCMERGVLLQAAGQTAWARLLSAYIGEPSVTFGVTLSGRSIVEEADQIAFPTIVTLPVSCDVVGGNGELLECIMRTNAKIHEHQFTPLTAIQRWTDNPGGKLFDTLFAFQKTAVRGSKDEPLWRILDEDASADFVVSIELQPTEDGILMLKLTCKESVVPAEQADLMLKQFDALLLDTLSTVADSSGAIDDNPELLSITPPKHAVLNSPNMLLHDFVSKQVQLNPAKTALEFTSSLEPGNIKSTSWTYAQLEAEANKIANLVQHLGVVQGQLVAICFDKCPEASFAIVGIMKAGCAYVALDPNAPADRVKFIMEDSKATVLLTMGRPGENLAGTFTGSAVQVINLDVSSVLHDCSTKPPVLSRPIDPQDTSYCLYTSGTTGTPKGCELSHENAVQAMYAFQHLFAGHWTPESKWLQFASFHFDVSVLEQFWSWSVGICVSSAPRDLIFEDIPGAIRQLGITHIDLTPSLARLLHPVDVPLLCEGVFITGGEQLRQDILDAWGEQACIYNGYGPTEATIGVTMYPRVPSNGKPANIGPQFLNVGSFVLKPGTNQPVLRGGVGELCVFGKLVGKGYLNRPELTAERFPYLEELGERVYRTGDLVRICHDGTFLFLGRADDQVKLRGQRLELSEITEVIKKIVDGLDDVVTLVLKHAKQQKEQLVTFFVPATQSERQSPLGLISPMRDACTSHLPGYMVPTHFVALENLPLSVNNKADKKQLADLYDKLSIEDLQKLSTAGQATRAWSASELEILATLADAMDVSVSDLKPGTNIFELGFDSISVIGLAQKLQKAGYENAKLAVVMKNAAIENLVGVLATEEASTGYGGVVAAQQKIAAFMHRHMLDITIELGIDNDAIEALAPCTAAQDGMIYRFLDNDEALYFTGFGFELSESVDLDRLKEAWSKVASHLEVLRLKFVLTNDGFSQVVLRENQLPWEIVEADGSSDEAFLRAREARHDALNKTEKTDALTNPYKITIVSTPSKRIMALDIFHGIYDGISFPLILRKVHEEYHGVNGIDYGPSFLSSLSHGPLATIEGNQELWRETIGTPAYIPLPEIENDSTLDVSMARIATGLNHLEALRQALGVTYQAILQAVWTVVLQNYLSTAASPAFGVVVSGRSIDFSGADRVIGPLLNTLVFHVNTDTSMSWKDLIRDCHDYNTAVLPLQHTPLKDVQKWCGNGESKQLFDSLFVFQREKKDDADITDLWREIEGEPMADYPLAFEATLRNDGDIALVLVGQGAYVNQTNAEMLLGQVEEAFTALKSADDAIPLQFSNSGDDSLNGREIQRNASAKARDTDTDGDFEWTPTATMIRSEISQLTEAPEESITPNTTLFSLGLDSIDIIRLSSRLKKKGVRVSVSVLVRSQTIASIMRHIAEQDQAPVQAVVSIQHYENALRASLLKAGKLNQDVVSVLLATPLQEGMVSEMVASGYTRYFNHELFKIHDGVDIEKLKEAWESTIKQHDILRTTFAEVDDVDIDVGFAQVVHKEFDANWEKVELPHAADLESEMKNIIRRAIELANEGKLIQLRGISHGEKRYYLLSISHALYDGWSLRALHEDVQRAYNDQLITRPDPKAALEQVINANGAEATKFWRMALSDLPRCEFPLHDISSGAVNRAERTSSIPLEALQAFCRSKNISLQTLGQTAWAMLLATYLKRLDVAFGAVLSCRDTEEANELMFPLMNTVAARAVLHGSLEDMLRYMQENSNEMRPFQHFPLRKAQALTGNGYGGLFDTLFIYQGRSSGGGENTLYTPVESQSEVEFSVCVEMEVVGEDVVWRTACRDAARTPSEADELLENIDAVMAAIVRNSDSSTIISSADGLSLCGLPAFVDETSKAKRGNRAPKQTTHPGEEWSATETAVRNVLSQVSKIPEAEISKDHSIFHLGLDSISAIKVSSLLRRRGIHIAVNEIMRRNTIRSMAETIAQRVGSRLPKEGVDVDAVITSSLSHIDRMEILKRARLDEYDVEDIMPVSAGQLYMLSRFHGSGGAQFAADFQYRVGEPLVKERLEEAWEAVQLRHSILRTVFLMMSDSKVPAVQVVLKSAHNPIVWNSTDTDVSPLRPLSLVVEGKEDYQVISVRILHALYDAVSLSLILQDLEALYADPNSVLHPPSNLKAFIARDLDSKVVNQREIFWKSYLRPAGPIPALAVAPTGKRIEFFASSVPIGNLTSRAQESGVTVDALILASFAMAYTEVIAADLPSIIGLYLANRFADTDLSSLAAPTLNLLPLCVDTTSALGEASERVQNDLLRINARENVGASLKEIYEWSGTRVNVFVNLLKSEMGEVQREGGLFANSVSVDAMLRPRKQVIDVHADAARLEEFVGMGESVVAAYSSCIDVELRLVDEGRALDVGIFAPEEMLDLAGAERLVGALREASVER